MGAWNMSEWGCGECEMCIIHNSHAMAIAESNADCACECIEDTKVLNDEEDIPIDMNREGDPAFNGAFDKW